MSHDGTSFFNGMAAEEIAARTYEARGGHVLERRWKVPSGEIDLIVEMKGVIVFVEVKARKTLDAAMSAVRPAQLARIYASAEQYLGAVSNLNAACRFDLAAVDRSGRIEIITNISVG